LASESGTLAALLVIALSCGDGRHIKYEYLPPAAGTACNNNHVPTARPAQKGAGMQNAAHSECTGMVWYGIGW